MARLVCRKCDAEAFGKCPACRTVFPENQVEAMLSHVLKFDKDAERGDVKVTYHAYECSVEEAFEQLFKTLSMMKEEHVVHGDSRYPNFREYSCVHEWVFAPGEKSDIGCGHK